VAGYPDSTGNGKRAVARERIHAAEALLAGIVGGAKVDVFVRFAEDVERNALELSQVQEQRGEHDLMLMLGEELADAVEVQGDGDIVAALGAEGGGQFLDAQVVDGLMGHGLLTSESGM